MIKDKTKFKNGFTLLELIIVIAIVSILYSIVITVIGPAEKIARAYDSQRLSDMNALNKAIQQYYIDNQSYDLLGISSVETEICDSRYTEFTEKISCGNFINLSKLTPDFIVAIPTDPLNLIAQPKNNPEKISGNGYTIMINDSKIITISSLNLSTNNTPISKINSLKVIDIRYQITLLAVIVIICVVIASYFIVKRYRNED